MSTSAVITLAIIAILFFWALFSGLLFRIFLNVLYTVGIVMLTGWLVLLFLGAVLCFGLPAFCGATGKDLVKVYNHIDKGDFSDFYH